MPKNNINYQNTIIYKFVCNDLNITDIYVGSTTDIRRRKAQHKQTCNNSSHKNHNLKIYQIMRLNGGFSNWTMLQIENFPCNNKAESSVRERHWLELLSATMNIQIPGRTNIEYYTDNKDTIIKYREDYKKTNKITYQNIKDSIREYNNNNKQTMISFKDNKFYCKCGGKYTVNNDSHHFMTKRHLTYLNTQVNNLQALNNDISIIENQINDIAIN